MPNTNAGLYFPHLSNYFRFSVKDNRVFFMCNFFLVYYETANYIRTIQKVFRMLEFTDSKMAITKQQWYLPIRW